jgi:AmiR/NasT family two-component response regulator
MRARSFVPDLGGARAIILHRQHPTVEALARQLRAIGLTVAVHWPDLGTDAVTADYVFFDADLGHDGQFPWPPGQSPMPLIALIGSEAPGRIEWALSQGAAGQIMKPVSGAGAFSALLIAHQAFEARRAMDAQIADLRGRLSERQTIVQAVAHLMRQGRDESVAYDLLRQMAMAWRVTIESAAQRVVSHGGATRAAAVAGPDGGRAGVCPSCGGNGVARRA